MQHRFLSTFDRVWQRGGKRVWALDGLTEDVYYCDAFHGALTLRHSLEVWAARHDFQVVAVLTGNGELEFSGSADPERAEACFHAATRARPPKYQHRFAASEPAGPEADGADGADAAVETAAGGLGQRMKNCFQRISRFITRRGSDDERTLLIVEDIPYLLDNAARGDEPLKSELRRIILTEWCVNVSANAILVFTASTAYQVEQTALFDDRRGTNRNGDLTIAAPSESEVAAALFRLACREAFLVRDLREIAAWQVGCGNDLRAALDNVISVVNRCRRRDPAGRPVLRLSDFLDLPEWDGEAVAQVRQRLDALVGLAPVKAALRRLETNAERDRQLLLSGRTPPAQTRHMLFCGNPGTGKTAMARLVGAYCKALGLLSGGQVVETGFGQLKSEFAGETGSRFRQLLEQAAGGVLFFDEIHQLAESAHTAPAREIIDLLVPALENQRHNLIFIGAGYAERMPGFWQLDPGLESRFPPVFRFEFPDFTVEELWRIFQLQAADLECSPAVEVRIRAILSARCRRAESGNARAVRMLLEAIRAQLTAGVHRIEPAHLPPLLERREEELAVAHRELDALIGLAAPRRMIQRVMDNLEYDMEFNAGQDGCINTHPGNMLFIGPPGTGKSTMARILAAYLYGLGVTERRDPVIVTAKDLIGEYLGQTAPKVGMAFARARGGILFLDEAYALADNQEFGLQAVGALVGEITLPANASVIVILAGYPGDTQKLFAMNEGLRRRIAHTIEFEAFRPSDCATLAERLFARGNYRCEEGFGAAFEQAAAAAMRRLGRDFGNAGWCAGCVDAVLGTMKTRVIRERKAAATVDPRLVLIEDLEGREIQ